MDTLETAAASKAGIDVRAAGPALTQTDWDARYATRQYIWTTEANLTVKQEARRLAPGAALDLACGEGRNAVWLASVGWSVRAVDFSAAGLDKAKRLAAGLLVSSRAHFVLADLRSFEPGLRCYDLVLMSYLQLPFGEFAPIIERAARAVAPGGTLLLVGHDASNIKHGFGGPRHQELLHSAGRVAGVLSGELVVERAGSIRRRVETATGKQTAIDCLVRAHRPV